MPAFLAGIGKIVFLALVVFGALVVGVFMSMAGLVEVLKNGRVSYLLPFGIVTSIISAVILYRARRSERESVPS